MKSAIISSLLILLGTTLSAQTRYEVAGDTLYFDMRAAEPGYEFTGQLEQYDVRLLSEYIFEYPEIRKLNITGPGGHMQAALEMAKDLISHNIDTIAAGECSSACTLVFLGGKSRTLRTNAKLGFHRQWVSGKEHKENYTLYKDDMEWKDEFEYLMFIYNKLNSDLVAQLSFMSDQGVSFDFIIRTLKTEVLDMWFPTQEELLASGYITE